MQFKILTLMTRYQNIQKSVKEFQESMIQGMAKCKSDPGFRTKLYQNLKDNFLTISSLIKENASRGTIIKSRLLYLMGVAYVLDSGNFEGTERKKEQDFIIFTNFLGFMEGVGLDQVFRARSDGTKETFEDVLGKEDLSNVTFSAFAIRIANMIQQQLTEENKQNLGGASLLLFRISDCIALNEADRQIHYFSSLGFIYSSFFMGEKENYEHILVLLESIKGINRDSEKNLKVYEIAANVGLGNQTVEEGQEALRDFLKDLGLNPKSILERVLHYDKLTGNDPLTIIKSIPKITVTPFVETAEYLLEKLPACLKPSIAFNSGQIRFFEMTWTKEKMDAFTDFKQSVDDIPNIDFNRYFMPWVTQTGGVLAAQFDQINDDIKTLLSKEDMDPDMDKALAGFMRVSDANVERFSKFFNCPEVIDKTIRTMTLVLDHLESYKEKLYEYNKPSFTPLVAKYVRAKEILESIQNLQSNLGGFKLCFPECLHSEIKIDDKQDFVLNANLPLTEQIVDTVSVMSDEDRSKYSKLLPGFDSLLMRVEDKIINDKKKAEFEGKVKKIEAFFPNELCSYLRFDIESLTVHAIELGSISEETLVWFLQEANQKMAKAFGVDIHHWKSECIKQELSLNSQVRLDLLRNDIAFYDEHSKLLGKKYEKHKIQCAHLRKSLEVSLKNINAKRNVRKNQAAFNGTLQEFRPILVSLNKAIKKLQSQREEEERKIKEGMERMDQQLARLESRAKGLGYGGFEALLESMKTTTVSEGRKKVTFSSDTKPQR